MSASVPFRVSIAFALLAVASGSRGAAASPPPRRIVSVNLCTDQLLLALADRGQIAGLTGNATDPGMSAAAGEARGLPVVGDGAEDLLAARPDLVIGMPASRVPAMRLLGSRHFRTLDLADASTIDGIYASIRQTAAAVGHPARGEALVAAMRRDLAALPRNGRGRVAVHYQRRGYVTGTGTLVDDLITRAGLVNLARREHRPVLAQMSLEEIVAARPDVLIVESGTDRVRDQGSEMLHHPALAGFPRISIPGAWTVCGGPAYVKAARAIATALAAR